MLGFLLPPLLWVSFVFSFYSLSFRRVGLLWGLTSTLRGPSWDFFSASLNPSHSTRDVAGMCNFLGSVSPQQRFEMVDQCYSSVTAEFYLASKAKYTLKAWRQADPNGEASIHLWLRLYTCVSSTPWARTMQIELAIKRACLFHLNPVFGFSLAWFLWGSSFLCL